jgi:hypothetical protein
MISNEQRLDELIEFLTEDHLDTVGGYPYDYCWLEDKLIVAGLDAGKEYNRTQVEIYDRKQLLAWHKRAERFAKKYPEEKENKATCFWETKEE